MGNGEPLVAVPDRHSHQAFCYMTRVLLPLTPCRAITFM